MKKLILCSITILCSGLLLAVDTATTHEEAVNTLKEYITLLDKKNTRKLLKKTPLTKEQLDECIALADSYLSAQLNNQGTEPTVDALESGQQLYGAIYFGAVGYLLGKLWLSYWPKDGLLSMDPELLPLYLSTGLYLYLIYLACYEQAKGTLSLLQRLVNRGELKKARAIKKMLMAHRESQFQMEPI